MNRKSLIRWIAIVGFNAVLFLFLAEAFSAVFVYLTENRFHYNEPATFDLPDPSEADELTRFRFHPYFGVVQKPGQRIHTTLIANNCGFSTRHDFPYLRGSDSEFIVGIFGGSVAEMFADVALDHFREQLEQIPALKGREIIILNFARGAYKQPQQLLVLTYFLSLGQSFDLVINLDGFNEVVLAQGNAEAGIHISMPSAEHILPLVSLMDKQTLTADTVALLHRLTRCREKITDREQAMSASTFAFSYLVRRVAVQRSRNEYSVLLQRYSTAAAADRSSSLVCLYDEMPGRNPGADTMDHAIQLWKNASLELHLASRTHDFRYFHFIQPNQYFSGKVFTGEELDQAVLAGSDRQVLAAAGYPRLLDQVSSLRLSGVAVFSLVDIFDEVAETVYVDDCCHVNKLGNHLLADRIAARIGQGM